MGWVNYPALLGLTASLRTGLSASMTRFADTTASGESAVFTSVDETRSVSFANQKSKISGDVDSEHPVPTPFVIPRERMFHAAFASRSHTRATLL
ncbi:hypothetical protein BG842_18165 [Haladaptatus sp. W1]|nr:hypothetical protein BG842_18165 [Haladaptatus sp. W1]